MPKLDIRLSDTGIDAELARLRARLETLSKKRIGIDVDAAAAMAEMDAIDAELARLGEHHPNIAVRVDTAAARAQLAAIREEVDSLDRDDVDIPVHVDTGQAQAALFQLAVALGSVAAIPVVPIAAAGLGALASAATAAGAGVGAMALVAIPAIKGISAALQAKTAAEKESTQATNNGASAAIQSAQRALQMANAQQALASAHRQAARSIEQANEQVQRAEESLAQAVQNAAYQRQQAAQNVSRAERSLADAQKQEQKAQEDLTQARRDARQELMALDDKLKDGALSQRDAVLSVQEAQEQLQKVMADPRSSYLEQQRAQLTYDQALQAQKEQAKSYEQLKEDAKKAKDAGVNGNDKVKQASEQLADAQRSVKDQVEAVAQAHQDAARTEIQSAQQVADAQRSVADAVRNAADTQVQAADSIASAERGVESARLSSMKTTSSATTKADAYRQALAKLTPEQRKLYDSIAGPQGLTSAFKAWSTSMQPAVLPLFVRGVEAAKGALPGLTPLVTAAADAIGVLFDKASKELKSPFWQGFKDDIDKIAKPAIIGLGIAFGNIFKGMAGIVDAFLPHMTGISSVMDSVTARFAKWGSNLKGSPAFERFLQYVKDTSPDVAKFLGQLLTTALDLSKALAPMSSVVYAALEPILSAISWLSTNAPEVVQLLWAMYVVGKLLGVGMRIAAVGLGLYNTVVAIASLETWSWAAAIQATGIVPLIELIVVAIVALAVGIYEAYKHVGWFHTAVDAAFTGIKVAAIFVWDKALKPMFTGLWAAIKAVGSVLVWLWKNIFVPVWNGIVLATKIAIAIIAVVLIAPLVIAIRLLGAVISALWTGVVKPTWELIAQLTKWLWNTVLNPYFNNIWKSLKWVGDKFTWLYNNAVKPACGWIADKAKWLWSKGLKPALTDVWNGLKWVGDKFLWLYDHSVGPIVGWIADKARWLYDKGLKPAFDSIKTAVKLVGAAFSDAKSAIKQAWDQIAGIAAKPVNFVISGVYTHGIKAVWDKVAEFVGLGKLPDAPKLVDERPKFAQGGRTSGGIPGVDSIPILAMADEYIIKRSSARKIGYGALEYMNRTGEIPRFASGGIIGSAWDWTKDKVGGAISKGVDWAKTGADLIAHPSKVWDKLVKPFLDAATLHLGVAQMGKVLLKYPLKMIDGLKDQLVDAVTGGGMGGGSKNIGGTIPSGQRRTIISQALAAAHVPPPGTIPQWLAGMNTLIMRESGWNPNAINLWDSNAKAGHPSQGLTQTIPSTWSAYVPSSLRSKGILDPVGNVAASIRYIVSRYGNITNVQQANANMPPKGYDSGGWLMPGFTTTYNGTGKPEPVFTSDQWADIRASKSAAASPTELNLEARVYVGNTELTDVIRTEIHTREEQNAAALNGGRLVF
ncbi:hypothetical protein SAMN04490357_1748 [Streptomyces misionensis]|uniref:Transglycosylase SLT domain-containing protein n=2 Tax=Streptomyces misionensis TaxID=67331 RepID=A0A1H4RNK0_9ACTN|nr:hypothetical protein SAMN04490357_1748 [Streptomyces misionensis]